MAANCENDWENLINEENEEAVINAINMKASAILAKKYWSNDENEISKKYLKASNGVIYWKYVVNRENLAVIEETNENYAIETTDNQTNDENMKNEIMKEVMKKNNNIVIWQWKKNNENGSNNDEIMKVTKSYYINVIMT